jgi:cephalosporin hydroxylase
MIDYDPDFTKWKSNLLKNQTNDFEFKELSKNWLEKSVELKYSYQFEWLGVPIIQLPTDMASFQDIIWRHKPDLIIECGVARGGSLIFWASMQEICGLTPNVLGIDIEIREHTHKAIANSRYANAIQLIQGSSILDTTAELARKISEKFEKVMVVLDSNHTHEHVLKELSLYSELVSEGQYLLVLDTIIDDLPVDESRPWGPGASPKSAVFEFMKANKKFIVDRKYEDFSMFTVAPSGFLRRI